MSRERQVRDNERCTLDTAVSPALISPQDTDAEASGVYERLFPLHEPIGKEEEATPPIVEGTVVESTVLTDDRVRSGWLGRRSMLRHGLMGVWVALTLVLVLALITDRAPELLGPLATLIPGLTPSASVTIIPDQSTVSAMLTATGVTGTPDSTRLQVQVRLLSVTSPARRGTGQATGIGHTGAQRSRGTLTFYNAATYPQTVAVGTVFTGADSTRVVNDAPAVIPAGDPPIEGQVTVAAHAAEVGPRGNIAALDINGTCCVPYVLVRNTGPFTGGQTARDYRVVVQQDIDGVGDSLLAPATQQAQATLQGQMQANEQPISPALCLPIIHTDHPAGSEATQVSVTVTVNCTVRVYDRQRVQQFATALLTQKAMSDLGTRYTLISAVTTDVKPAKRRGAAHGSLSLLVKAKGIWVYQFTEADIHHLSALVAGKSQVQAQILLMQQVGIRTVSITLAGGDRATFPSDPQYVRIVVLPLLGAGEVSEPVWNHRV
jgi:hypothetical protein